MHLKHLKPDFAFNVILFLDTLTISFVKAQLATWSSVYESPIIKEPKPGWARFCKGDQIYDTFANQCPVGIFWNKEKQDTHWDCVCTRGPWRRSGGWCTDEDTQRFTQGDITCFQPDAAESEGLQAMYYVGDRFSAWDSSLPILLTDYRSGIPVRKGDFSVEWEITSRTRKEPGILIYRPRDDWAVHDKMDGNLRLCLRAPDTFNEETEGLFIYNISSLFNENGSGQTFQLSITRGCYSWKEHDQIEWEEVIPENLQNKNMIVQAYNQKTAPPECVQCMLKPIPPPPEADIDGGPLEDREEFTIYDLKNVAVLKTEIDLQSERLGQYWAHRMLQQNVSDIVTGNFQELEILIRSAIMASDTCNSTFVPLEFYQYFLIMFRMLLSESFKKFPPKGPISKQYYEKINELLNKCKNRKLNLTFELGTTCPALYEGFTVGPGTNGTESQTQTINVTKDYTSDKGRHDFLLEFIWRLNTFLHYKCFEEFEQNSVLLDVIQQQLESVFTEDLILRWYNPGASFQMYSLIFENHLDLDTVMKNFQRCVTAVHDVSKYPGWLKRPIDRPEVTSKKVSKGSTRRFKRSYNNVGVVSSRTEGRIRRKRDADTDAAETSDDDDYDDDEDVIKGPFNLFAGTAACIKSVRSFMMDTDREAGPTCW